MDAKCLVDEARAYLLAFPGVTVAILDAHLLQWKQDKKDSIEALFRALLGHAQNRQGMPNAIGNVENLRTILFGFSPSKVIERYPTPQELLTAIRNSGLRIPGRIDPANRRNLWVIYTQAILSCARFMASFDSAVAFHNFVERFYFNEHSRLALPLLLKEELFGFGFALSCDFLKDNGYPEFIKPDTHINDITRGVGITSATTDFGVFKDVVAYCRANSLVPYEFDKLLWLIGSGSFYLNQLRVPSDKWAFIERAKMTGRGHR